MLVEFGQMCDKWVYVIVDRSDICNGNGYTRLPSKICASVTAMLCNSMLIGSISLLLAVAVVFSMTMPRQSDGFDSLSVLEFS